MGTDDEVEAQLQTARLIQRHYHQLYIKRRNEEEKEVKL
jgi:hypothetical protein